MNRTSSVPHAKLTLTPPPNAHTRRTPIVPAMRQCQCVRFPDPPILHTHGEHSDSVRGATNQVCRLPCFDQVVQANHVWVVQPPHDLHFKL